MGGKVKEYDSLDGYIIGDNVSRRRIYLEDEDISELELEKLFGYSIDEFSESEWIEVLDILLDEERDYVFARWDAAFHCIEYHYTKI